MILNPKNTIISTITCDINTDSLQLCRNLEYWYNHGFRKIECSAIYPLFGGSQNFRKIETIIAEWIVKTGIKDIELYFKVGYVDNNSPEREMNFSRSFLLMLGEDYIHKFGSNLKCLILPSNSINNLLEIKETVSALKHFSDKSIQIGITYQSANDLQLQLMRSVGIRPLIFVAYNQEGIEMPSTEIIQESNILIDYCSYLQSSFIETKTYQDEDFATSIISSFEKLKTESQLPVDIGLVISIKDTSFLDSLIIK